MITIREVDFDDIRQPWQTLEDEGKLSTVFQTAGWIETWSRYLLRDRQPLMLAAYQDGQLTAVMPLYKEWASIKGIRLFKVLRFMGYAESDYHDLIIQNGEEAKIISHFLSDLRHRDWQIAAFGDFYHSSLYVEIILQKARDCGYHVLCYPHTVCPYIHLPGAYEEYIKTINKTTKTNILYYHRRLQKRGYLQVEVVDGSGDIDGWMQHFFNLHEGRWRLKGESGALAGSRLKEFHLAVARRLAKYFHSFSLLMDGRRIAVDYDYVFNRKLCSYLKGWDPEYNSYRVGSILIMDTIREAIARGLKEMDFMRGDEPYKFLFTKTYRRNFKIVIAKDRFHLQLWRLLDSIGRK